MQLVILDRDGVINKDSDDFIKSPSEWLPLPGSLEAIARLHRAGWHVVVATNQSGIARKLYDHDTLMRIHEKMHRSVREAGGLIDAVFFCPHGPDDGCDCRKPRPGLYHAIAHRLGITLQEVPAIGDALRDLQAAQAAGAQPILVTTGKGAETRRDPALSPDIPVYANLADAVDALLTNTVNTAAEKFHDKK